LVRKKNAGAITAAQFAQALLEFEQEIVKSLGKHVVARRDDLQI
jgi:hypothetical protein